MIQWIHYLGILFSIQFWVLPFLLSSVTGEIFQFWTRQLGTKDFNSLLPGGFVVMLPLVTTSAKTTKKVSKRCWKVKEDCNKKMGTPTNWLLKTPWKMNMKPNHGGVVHIILPFFSWLICRWFSAVKIFQGVYNLPSSKREFLVCNAEPLHACHHGIHISHPINAIHPRNCWSSPAKAQRPNHHWSSATRHPGWRPFL